MAFYQDWDTTPSKLRVAQIFLVLGVLFVGGVGLFAAIVQVNTTRDIAKNVEPLNDTVTRLYRSLAEADATVAAGYLSGGVEPAEIQTHYGRDLADATASLAQASTQAGGEPVTTKRITDITTQLPVYTGLVERARANNREGFAVGVSYLRSASDLMQNSILPVAAELQQRQAARLDDAYRLAGSVPVVALASCMVSLAGLIWAQVFLFRRTHRVVNIGLVIASAAVITGLVWWTVTGVASGKSLTGAFGHSRSVSDALAPAQIAALQARAFESLELVDRTGDPIEPKFTARMHELVTSNGVLGSAQHFATDQHGKALVQAAVADAHGYATAHQEVRELDDAGKYIQAVDAAVKTNQPGAATAFDQLNMALTTAIEYERGTFEKDIERARGWLTGLPFVTVALALISAVGVAWGVQQRLEEYQ
ncbi:MAG: hypothetical protein WCF33_08495 [Pseudonocardiaceae bacterium]